MQRLKKKKFLKLLIGGTIYYIIFLLLAGIVLWSQIRANAFISGTDSVFHMNRFYETAMQIKTGHFNYFQSIFGFNHSGRIINAFYGPVMAYFNGLLLLICGSWSHFEIVNSLLSLSLGGFLMYLFLYNHKVKRWIAVFLSTLYMTSYSISIWATSQEFTGWGSVFMPLALWCGITMLDKHRIAPIKLALIITIIVQTHLISSILATVALLPFFVVGMIKTKHPAIMFDNALKAAGITVLLTGNVWGSILEMLLTNRIIPIFPQQQIMSNAININGFSLSIFGPFYTIIFIVLIIITIVNWDKFDYRWKTVNFTGYTFLWISSQLFPWNWLHSVCPALTNLIQFPKRIVVIPIILLSLAFGKAISAPTSKSIKKSRFLWIMKYTIIGIMTALSVFQLAMYVNSNVNNFKSKRVVCQPLSTVHINGTSKQLRHSFRTHKLSLATKYVQKSTPDYLPTTHSMKKNSAYYNLHPYYYVARQINSSSVNVHTHITPRHFLKDTWYNSSDKDKKVIIPLAVYKQSHVRLNGHKIKHPKISQVGALEVHAKPGHNKVTVGFEPSFEVQVIIVITIISWIMLASRCIIIKER